jgi:hypothetical protein
MRSMSGSEISGQESEMIRRRQNFRNMVGGATAFIATALLAGSAGAQDYAALDRALGKANPGAELVANFNELVSSAANVGAAAPTDADRAEAEQVRAVLQNPSGVTRAKDATSREATQASAEFQQIGAAASRLDQSIGTRLSADARKSLSNDFQAVGEYMAVASPGSNWYCRIKPLGALIGC